MTETPAPSGGNVSRVLRDVLAVLCLFTSVALINTVAWWKGGVAVGLVATAADLAGLGLALGLAR